MNRTVKESSTDATFQIACGFVAGAERVGMKPDGNDLAIIFSEAPAVVAGVFTKNRVRAAPVVYSSRIAANGRARAIVANSGNANACTGQNGEDDVRAMAGEAATRLGIDPDEVIVASTGVIGVPLPIDSVCGGIRALCGNLSQHGIKDAAEAILTTDTVPKLASASFECAGAEATITGMAKGAGMIAPHMATMLAFLTTDVAMDAGPLQSALAAAVESSFNRITVDGDTSTNDMVVILANGESHGKKIQPDSNDYEAFSSLLRELCQHLARQIVLDGEGATKFVEIAVRGAATDDDARAAARTVAESLLVKTALFGGDPNWGRIMAALGRSGAEIDPGTVDVSLNEVQLVLRGEGVQETEGRAAEALRSDNVRITIVLEKGNCDSFVWTTDLSSEYVRINAHYRT